MPAKTRPATVPSVAGVAIHDPRYATPETDPYLPEGTLVAFTLRLAPTPHGRTATGYLAESWRNCAIVQVGGVDPDTRTVRAWSIGLDGWVPDLSFPTAEAAVKALGRPDVVRRLRKHTADYHTAWTAQRDARIALARQQQTGLDLAAELGATSDWAHNAEEIRQTLALHTDPDTVTP